MSCYIKDNPSYLQEALESIADQNILPREFVLVCDGPLTDTLNTLIHEFETVFLQAGVEFKIIRLENNVGLGGALSIGSKFCSEDYIVRMDSDDISTKTRINDLYLAVKSDPDADVIGAQIEEFNKKIHDLGRKRLVPKSTSEIKKFARFRNPMNHVTVCIKRLTLEKVGGYEDMLWHEDYFLWLKMLNSGAKLVNLPVINVFVRVDDLSVRRSGWNYFRAEMSFIIASFKRGYITFFNGFFYIFSRAFVRLAPSSLIYIVYKFLRKN